MPLKGEQRPNYHRRSAGYGPGRGRQARRQPRAGISGAIRVSVEAGLGAAAMVLDVVSA